MILFPAIDIKDGQCVRLLRGDMSRATVFGQSPPDQASAFEKSGCEWLHVVDLDAAMTGHPVNTDAIVDIVSRVSIPVQLGGGIRDLETIAHWLDAGVARVILGTAAIETPELLERTTREFPNRVAVAIDARHGRATSRGWVQSSDLLAEDLARRVARTDPAAIIYTSVERDGAMEGPDISATSRLASRIDTPVIASGGIASMDDLMALRDCGANLAGAICGRAIYEKRVDVGVAIQQLRTKDAN